MDMNRRILLASGSPRRKELLAKMGVHFEAITSDFEEYLDDDRPVTDVAIELGIGKAQVLAERYPDAIVIGSDTIVSVGERQYGKPDSETDARLMLYGQVGHKVTVTTSVVVMCKELNVLLTAAPQAMVVFKRRNDRAIAAYIATGDWRDKAAAWGIQSGAAPLIDHIEGEYSTIIGLPVPQLAAFLLQLGIPTHPVLLTSPVPQKR
jgi:septum formation protein